MNMPSLHHLDWLVIAVYLFGLLAFGLWLSFRQFSRADYYVSGRSMGSWPIAISIMATQCSTNSILGAPAFVAFTLGGGLVWLQYELAVPLAMLAIILYLLPTFHRLQLVSVYEYLEKRFDLKTRLILSGLFQFVRAFATAVTIYSIALVIELITGVSFLQAVLILGVFTVAYDVLGGIRGVVYSDVIQLTVLVVVLVMVLCLLIGDAGGLVEMFQGIPGERLTILDFSHHGLGDGQTFAFWPMLFGGFFLYVSYYGCDQSQIQRTLCARSLEEGRTALMLNGLLRFPLVLLYCLVGIGIGSYALHAPEFVTSLPLNGDLPNYNLVVPQYILQNLPVGLVGLALVALFAAAMSSLDSVLNSLSASTMEDFVRRFHTGDPWSENWELWISRFITLAWGAIATVFSFFVGDIATSVLEAINKIGSLINGPVLGVFVLGLFTRKSNGTGATLGLIAGFMFNLVCWLYLPSLSWLWWNVFGLFVCIGVGYATSLFWSSANQTLDAQLLIGANRGLHKKYGILPIYFAVVLMGLMALSL